MKTEPLHILCINPWIHDFAAYDFWARPLGLLSIASILRENGAAVSFIDCLDRFHPQENRPVKVLWDGRGPFRKTRIDPLHGLEHIPRKFCRYGIKPQWFEADLRKAGKPDIIFVTSQMTYWASGVKETIERTKAVYPDVPVVLGGIYASLCFDHAVNTAGADLVVKGPGEARLGNIIKKITGFDFMGREVNEDLDALPFPAFDLMNAIPYIPVLTSRGCPFSCEYCACSYLEPDLRRRSPDNVFREIRHWHGKFGVKNFAFYDDALLVNSQKFAFPMLEKIISSEIKAFFHTPNALHVREINTQAAELMFRAGFKTIRLGLETTDFSSRRKHDVKVRENEFFRAVNCLKKAGFERNQVGAYLLCGLPGQNLDDVQKSVELVKKTGIMPVLAYYTPIPHTPMWDKAVKFSKFDLTQHPVFTNNTLFPCVRTPEEMKRISQLKNLSV